MVVQDRGRIVEDQEIDAVVPEAFHEQGRELRPKAEGTPVPVCFVDVDGYVDIAVWLRSATGVRTEQVGLEYFRARFKQTRDARAQTTVIEAMIFVAWFSAHLFSLSDQWWIGLHVRPSDNIQTIRTDVQ